MPIIIDDAFVNFDEVRKTSMNQVLEKVSEKIQILYFTFDQQTIDSFNQEQIISLESVDKNVDRKDWPWHNYLIYMTERALGFLYS